MGGKRSTTCCYLLLFFMFITTSSRIRISQGADTLLQYQSLRDGQTLISANKTFVFGFFSPGSSTNRYVGIWYFKASKTVVWVANRYNPIADKSGVLTFDSTGDLILVDGLGNSFPLANGFGPFRGNNILVKILDSGNLIFSSVNNSSMIMWQSFDYPTDTFLPGMKLGRIDKRNRFLTSWKSEVDPAPGDFSFGIDPNGTLQYFIWKEGRTIYWTSGLWNGKIFSQVPEHAQNYIYDFEVVSYQAEAYFSYSVKDENIISRFVMDISGKIQQSTWLDSQESWMLFWSIPRDSCDVYNKCGEFGFCNNQSQACECLQGFQPASLEDWKEGRTGDGCIRKASLECDSRRNPDKYLKMPSMKIVNPYAITIIVSGAKECESACYRNCNCTAYAFSGNCSLWHGDLQNLLKIDDSDDTGALYIRLAGSEFQQPPTASEFRGNKRKVQIVVSIIVSLTLLLSCSLMCFLWMRGRRHKERSLFALSNDISVKIGEGERAIDFLFFHFLDIEKATNNFSDENKLGEGGFGPVYKGQFLDGHEIAVKRLSAHSGQGLLEFRNEIILIAKLQHRNLVRLLGCCIGGGEKILVYEYMPNKSLDFFLFDTTRRALLDWTRRSLIIEGIAQGLLYLHKHSRFRIIHRDLKASNILLDADMNAKISDFGMARIVGSNETQANTNRVVGTYGYIAPEYAAQGQFSIKSDVFSFGVLLLEIISAKRNTGYHQHGNSLNLLGHAWQLWKEGRWSELKDPSLGDGCAAGEVSRCIHVALMCVQENAGDRPTISDVITMLSSDNLALPDPKQPAFFRVTTITEAEQSSNLAAHCSLHEMTITTPEGR